MRQSLFSPLPSIVKIRFSWYTLFLKHGLVHKTTDFLQKGMPD